MTNYNFSQIAGHIHTLPIRAVSIKSAYLDKALHFYKLESESSYKFSPIQTTKTNGEVITIGHTIEVNLYIVHNDFTRDLGSGLHLQGLLYQFRNKRVRCQLAIGNVSTWDLRDTSVDLSPSILEANNSTKGMYLDLGEKLTFNYEIESIELRPRLLIKMTGLTTHIGHLNSITETGNDYLFN